MFRPFIAFLLTFICTLIGCTEEATDTASVADTPVVLSAAFVNLDSVDVYTMDGEYTKTVDASTDFQDVLPAGSYYMDFIDENGNHSFLDDGRLAFAPMGDGILPIDGPFEIDSSTSPVWQVDVNSVLEANAEITLRAANGDETLRPWKNDFPNWQVNLPEDLRDPIKSDASGIEKGYSLSTGSTTTRLAVTYQLSYAMTGSTTSSCTSTSCWNMSSTASGKDYVYSYMPYFISDNDSAWKAVANGLGITSGNVSCRDNPTASGFCKTWSGSTCTAYYGCGPTYGSSYPGTPNADDYACQTSTGTCPYGPFSHAYGGQCKTFQNYALYMAGSYRSSGAFKSLPSDKTITAYSSTGSDAPTTSISNIAVGDVLRRLSSAHSMTVVAYDSGNQIAIVVDSNLIGSTSTFNEYIAAHVVGFNTATYSGYYQLSNYRDVKCVYNSSPC